MTFRDRTWRHGTSFMNAALSLVIAAAPAPGWAQPAAADHPADPPARVGQLAQRSGTVSYHLAGADRWETATLNLPVTTGSAFWTEPRAQAALEITGTRLALDQSTELDIPQLDDHTIAASLPQGTLYVHLRRLAPGDRETVQTPRGDVTLMTAGRYELSAGDTQHPTVVTVVEGEATVTETGLSVQIGPGQAATITGGGTTPLESSLGPAGRDAFLTAMLQQERPPRRQTVAAPAFIERMTGGEVLADYGDWAEAPEYGPVWYPPVEAGYVPYRAGHWSYVAPWGWTWVDDAPWGFAPSHYGRWCQVAGRWGWVPGEARAYEGTAYPVYAPALVSFLGGVALGALAQRAIDARGAATVGWVPLGPREPYYPPYRVSDGYVRNVNISHVTNINTVVTNYNTVINRGTVPQGPLLNRSAATMIPAAAMAESRDLRIIARPAPVASVSAAAPLTVQPPLSPTRATAGVTQIVARQFNLAPAPPRAAAAGPAIRAATPAAVPEPAEAPRREPPPAASVSPALRAPGEPRVTPSNGGAPGPALSERGPAPAPYRNELPHREIAPAAPAHATHEPPPPATTPLALPRPHTPRPAVQASSQPQHNPPPRPAPLVQRPPTPRLAPPHQAPARPPPPRATPQTPPTPHAANHPPGEHKRIEH